MGHPSGVEPWGCRLLRSGSGDGNKQPADLRQEGLGQLAALDDATLLQVLGLLTAQDLFKCCLASKALYCFATHEPLWKAVCVEELDNFEYHASWRYTYIGSRTPGFQPKLPLQVAGMYSDVLFQSWHAAHSPLEPEWLQDTNIERRDASKLTVEQFRTDFELPNRPVIVTGEVTRWPAFTKWTWQHLGEAFKGRRLNAGGCQFSFENYLKYSASSRDELPLYLFDKQCLSWTSGEGGQPLSADYQVPAYFQEDLFSVMGAKRPDWRWLIVGPARSGSSFHMDPNSTSAWNAVISGSKKWVLFPPSDEPPPGVFPSPDGLEVSSPYTLFEWFDSFYSHAQEDPNMMEGVCKAGEVLFVPSGWWHLAINLEETVAITQNFVSQANLPQVLRHLQNPTLVSGCSTEARAHLHDRFMAALKEHRPEVLEALTQQKGKQCKRQLSSGRALSALFAHETEPVGEEKAAKKRMAVASESKPAAGFQFGFTISS